LLRALYNKVLALAASRQAPVWLAGVSFAESSFFPIPPDVMLAPMVLARPERAWRYAAICAAASVIGGMLGYAIGYYLADFAQSLLAHMPGAGPHAWEGFQREYAKWGVWVILIKGLTPIPYKIVTIASGLAKFSFPVFVAASVVTRSGRFFLVAWLVRQFGPQIMPVVEKRLYSATAILIVLIVGGVVLARYLSHG
jgi:membrane protein YqaA with SNARE-associated domain